MAGGRLGSTREGKDPWKDLEVIGTQQRPGSGFKEAWLGFKTPPCVVSVIGKQKGGGEQQAAAMKFPMACAQQRFCSFIINPLCSSKE